MPSDQARAFRTLEHRLFARRLDSMDLALRASVLVFALAASAFVYWRLRIPMDGLAHASGAPAAARHLALALAAFAAFAGALAATRHAHLVARPPGPAWLALPLDPSRVARHLLVEARGPALVAFPPAAAALLAGIGLVPWTWLALMAAAFLVAWLECTRLAAAISLRAAAPRSPSGRSAIERVLIVGPRRLVARANAAATIRVESRWRALARLDARLVARRPALSARLLATVALACVAFAATFSPAPDAARRALAFGGYTLACTALGGLVLAVTCAHPGATARALPIAPADHWRARALPALAALLVLTVALVLAPSGGSWPVRVGMLVGWPIAGAMIVALGLHVALTLTPRASAAENVFVAWLGMALVASLMIPLLGWAVLLAGLIHATRRLSRWWRPEVEAC